MAVAALDLEEASAAAVADELHREFGVPAISARVDVADTASVAAAADHVRGALGGCDVVCSNVGVQRFGAIDRLTDAEWRWVLDVNVVGTVRTVRAFLPLLREANGWRRVVLTSSSSVLAPSIRMAAYQTSKFAVVGFAESLREELAAEGIGVTVLFPGPMITRHLETSEHARPDDLEARAVDDDLAAMLAHSPLQDGDLVTADHAVRNLLADLFDDAPYVVTHGAHRPDYERRRAALDEAFDRMESS
jgi:NAD(P)-dependent dehydrogenase (short-subunit alcohol dehydrogenase family)